MELIRQMVKIGITCRNVWGAHYGISSGIKKCDDTIRFLTTFSIVFNHIVLIRLRLTTDYLFSLSTSRVPNTTLVSPQGQNIDIDLQTVSAPSLTH